MIVKTQLEVDNLPDRFTDFTYIEIHSDKNIEIVVKKTPHNCQVWACGSSQVTAYDSSQVRAYGSSQVTAYDSSQVRAYGSSQVTAYDSSQVTAYGSSQVTAYDSSQVRAYGSSQVTAYGSSQVRACGSSQVTAYDSSQVTAYGSSQVRACGSSQVRAYGSSQVRAWGNSVILVLSALVILQKVKQYSVIILDNFKVKPFKRAKTAKVIHRKSAKHTQNSFIDFHNLQEDKEGNIILYKSVKEDRTDFRTGTIKYEGIVNCPDFDPDVNRECGGGLHLCATAQDALSFNKGKILKCKVNKKDFIVYSSSLIKVRCKKVTVIEE